MIVLDAFALIAALGDEPARAEVEAMLVSDEDLVTISAVNLAEVVDVLVLTDGRDVSEVVDALGTLTDSGLLVLPAADAVGLEAGRLRARHYVRGKSDLSLADAFALATATTTGATIATADPVIASIARAIDVHLIPLPDSQGRRP